MKKIITLFYATAFICSFSSINAQMKFNFEEWTDSTDFSRPNPVDFFTDPNMTARETLNSDQTTATPTPVAVCAKSSDAKTDFLAAELTVNAYELETPYGTFNRNLNGWLYTGVMNFNPMTYITTPDLRIANTEKWLNFSGWYKYEPATDDSCVFYAELYAADSTVVAQAIMKYGAAAEYTKFNIPFEYSDESTDVTHMGLYISASNTAVDNGAWGGEAGSKLIIDDLEFSSETVNITQSSFEKSLVHVYVSNMDNILHVMNAENAVIEIYSITGKNLLTESVLSNKENISISKLNQGLYIYTISSKGILVKSGKFTK